MKMINKLIKSFIVISRYNEDMSWIKEYDCNYIIYNKGELLSSDYNQIIVPNFGANQYDISRFIYDNYENLPDLICFLQGNPFDHCLTDRFNSLIISEEFTTLFGDAGCPDGKINGQPYFEANTSWYINEPWNNHKPVCKFQNFHDFGNYMFSDYDYPSIVIFPPGSQLIVEKERCLFYTKNFWKKLMDCFCHEIGMNGGREAHIIERSIQLIFENKYKERN